MAVIEHIDFFTACRLFHVRRADEHGKALLTHELLQDLPELAARQRVDADRRFIEQQESRRTHERAGEAELLLHAARQLAGEALRKGRQLRHLEKMAEALLPDILRHTVQVCVEVKILLYGQVLVEAEFLRHIAEQVLHRLRSLRDIKARHMQAAVRLGHEPADEPHQRRLARTVRPHESGELSFRHK